MKSGKGKGGKERRVPDLVLRKLPPPYARTFVLHALHNNNGSHWGQMLSGREVNQVGARTEKVLALVENNGKISAT